MAELTVLTGVETRDLTKLDEYRAIGGYSTLEQARGMEPQQIIDMVSDANLRGRGGAGFPMGRKLSLVPPADRRSGPAYVVANADESEPGAFKDREIMGRVPHRFIEGCLIAAHALQAKHAFIYIRGEYLAEYEVLERAVEEAREAGVLGDVDVVVHRGAGAYICGEESALLESLEGERGQPRPRPPFPPVAGLYMEPTLINNVQTIASVPAILELGVERYKELGAESAPGTVVYSLSGNVTRPGNYELPLGTTIRELIFEHGRGVAEGRALKAVIPGGSSVPIFTPDQIDVALDFDSVQANGSYLGSAAVIVVDDRACMVQLALRAEKFYMHESCGKCTPCREGTRWLVQLLERIEAGDGTQEDLDLFADVCDRIEGKSLCALGDFAVWCVASYLEKFRDEFQRHIDEGRCPYGGHSSIDGVLAPSDRHAHSAPAEVPA
jgi:NADH-quinone oxidoreductase subunit F